MSDILGNLSRLVTARPWVTIGVLLIITVMMAAGAGQRASVIGGTDLAGGIGDNAVVSAVGEIDDLFEEIGGVNLVTLIFRGKALTPDGLSQMDELIEQITTAPDIAPLLTPTDAILSPAAIVQSALGADDLASISQANIDAVLSTAELGPLLDALTGSDADGTSVAIATLRLRNTDEERSRVAERQILELATASSGGLSVSSVSPVIVEDEYQQATEEGMAPFIGIALVLILLLILLFLRTLSDLVLALVGLLLSLIWVIGAEGWLGPDALGGDWPAQRDFGPRADHRDQPHRRLCDPDRLPLPGTADRWRIGRGRGADRTPQRDDSARARCGDDDGQSSCQPLLAAHIHR